MIIKTTYDLGEFVYLKTCTEQHQFLITGICHRINRTTYELAKGTTSTWHDEIEISQERYILKATS